MLFHAARITWFPSERCCLCGKGFRWKQVYARAENGKMAHFHCAANKQSWKRESRKKKAAAKLEFAPVNRPIRVIKHAIQGD